ncbi:MAG: glycoside hydrolase family 2 protein [Armatimonadetes bacterium]|nr:glycoside hydrolase family 2 protein [Armatimonadota bacterium]
MNTPQTFSLSGTDWQVYHLLPNEWLWRRVWERDPPEAASRRLPATVPGHVQQDLLAAGVLPHPWVGLNSHLWEWTSARDWVYTREFTPPAAMAGMQVRLRFEGVDSSAHVFLNGEPLGDHEGQFVPVEFDVTGRLRPGESNRLVVVVERAPEEQGQIGWTSRCRSPRGWKARFAYGWDGCPRLIPVGIWDDVSLVATGPVWFRDVAVYANLSTDQTEAALSVVSEFGVAQGMPVTVGVQIQDAGLPVVETQDPVTVFDEGTSLVQSLAIKRARLWWPNGHGDSHLYEAVLVLATRDGSRILDHRRVRFGLRRIEVLPCEDAPPDSLPYLLSVNGRRVWIKGWNWVPQDQFYARAAPERYERLLALARDAGVNMLRVWGGGLLEKEVFYDLCDRFGILVWQEFPLSSSGLDNEPPADPEYLDRITAQAEAMLPRRRNHPSLALWCGGNELTGSDLRPLDSGHPTLGALRNLVAVHDPQRLWLPTSPTGPRFSPDPACPEEGHDVHGPWRFLGLREHPAFYHTIRPLLHSAFGCEGATNPAALHFLSGNSPAALWPPDASNALWMHHGGWWEQRAAVEAAFGPLSDLDTYVRASQLLQAMGLQVAVESHRRRKWHCAGVLPWQFNEPWPNAVCTHAVDWFGQPKPAYWAVRRAYRPVHVSARFTTFAWHGEKEFIAEIWLHNSGEALGLLTVAATISSLDGRVHVQDALAGDAPAHAARRIGELRWEFPTGFAAPFLLDLQVTDRAGEVIARNAYPFSAAPDPAFAPFLTAAPTALELERAVGGIRVRNAGECAALWVTLDHADDGFLSPEDNHFLLRPQEARALAVREALPVRAVAWNAPAVLIV